MTCLPPFFPTHPPSSFPASFLCCFLPSFSLRPSRPPTCLSAQLAEEKSKASTAEVARLSANLQKTSAEREAEEARRQMEVIRKEMALAAADMTSELAQVRSALAACAPVLWRPACRLLGVRVCACVCLSLCLCVLVLPSLFPVFASSFFFFFHTHNNTPPSFPPPPHALQMKMNFSEERADQVLLELTRIKHALTIINRGANRGASASTSGSTSSDSAKAAESDLWQQVAAMVEASTASTATTATAAASGEEGSEARGETANQRLLSIARRVSSVAVDTDILSLLEGTDASSPQV